MLSQLLPFLKSSDIFEPLQSGFSAHHSTESALLKVFNDLLSIVDSGNNAVLILLDLTAAFDTVDHDVFIARLEHWAGVKGTSLQWFRSYLTNRAFSVTIYCLFLKLLMDRPLRISQTSYNYTHPFGH